MIDLIEIRSIPSEELRDATVLARLKKEIMSPENVDRRDEALLELGERLLEESMTDEAAEMVRSVLEWLPEKAAFLADVAGRHHNCGQVNLSNGLFEESILVTQVCPTRWQQAEALVAVAEKLHGVGATQKALELVGSAKRLAQKEEREAGTQDSLDASSVLKSVACAYVVFGANGEGLGAAKQIKSAPYRRSALKAVRSMIRRQT